MAEVKNVATMSASELEEFIQQTEREHRAYVKSLKALMRVRREEERKE